MNLCDHASAKNADTASLTTPKEGSEIPLWFVVYQLRRQIRIVGTFALRQPSAAGTDSSEDIRVRAKVDREEVDKKPQVR